jgi:hypothetical protein
MQSRFLNTFIISKEKALSLKKLRIIKQNLVHIQGLSKSLLNIEKLKSKEYFGQYGKIVNIVLSQKTNPENNKKIYSVYITYENKIEAACAILCVDSLLIKGKIIRAFFGTTKYCSHFLNNRICPNIQNCTFLHQFSNEDIIIDDNTNFSYNEHLNMSRKIIEQTNLDIRSIFLRKPENSKIKLPFLDFIFLSEDQKQKYFHSSDIIYIKSSDNRVIEGSIQINFNIVNIYNNTNKNQKTGFNPMDAIYNRNIIDKKNFKKYSPNNNINIQKYQDPFELYNIFKDSIKHILMSKPFYASIKNAPLEKMEYYYFKNDLSKKGVDIELVLGGCLDCIQDA